MTSISDALATAVKLHQANEFQKAEDVYRQVLDSDPENPDALHLLGLIASRTGRHAEAIDHIRRALGRQPDNVTFQKNLAIVYHQSGDLEKSARTNARVLQLAPQDSSVRLELGKTLLAQNRLQHGITVLSQLLETNPNHTAARQHLICAHRQMGDRIEVERQCRKLIELEPANTRAFFSLSELPLDAKTQQHDMHRLNELLSTNCLGDEQRKDAHFALGNLYDRSNQFDLAFEHYALANRLKGAIFDPDLHAQVVSSLIETFSRKLFSSINVTGSDTEQPLFIIGMQRSGTTLVEQIVSSHPQVYAAGELPTLSRLAAKLPELIGTSLPYPRAVARLDHHAAKLLASAYLDSLPGEASKFQRVTDKRNSNFHYLGLISLLFPNARVIHCQRDPLDTCLSSFFQNFDHVVHSFDLRHLGLYYRQYERLMKHWAQAAPIQIYSVRYEELVRDQQAATRRLLGFCGLDWHECQTRFESNGRPVNTASLWQVRQPIHQRSVDRWKNYERHLQPLKEALDCPQS